MTPDQIVSKLKGYLADPYPDIHIEAKPWADDSSRLALYFREEEFSVLYPQQRYHYLVHAIPGDFFNAHLRNSDWFELAPGEDVEDLRYPDEDLIDSIAPDVLSAIERAEVFSGLDDLMAPETEGITPADCHGDFRYLKRVLAEKGFGARGEIDEIFDICHVVMAKGGYCVCEVLYNVSESNRLKARYWKKRAEEARPPPGHASK